MISDFQTFTNISNLLNLYLYIFISSMKFLDRMEQAETGSYPRLSTCLISSIKRFAATLIMILHFNFLVYYLSKSIALDVYPSVRPAWRSCKNFTISKYQFWAAQRTSVRSSEPCIYRTNFRLTKYL